MTDNVTPLDHINLNPVDMDAIRERVRNEVRGQYGDLIEEIQNPPERPAPVDLNEVITVVEARDREVEEIEEFVPEPLPDDQVEPLNIELIEVEGTPPETTAADIMYVPARKFIHSPGANMPQAAVPRDNNGYPLEAEVDVTYVDNEQGANLVSSECQNGQHAPVIDIDIPIQVYPSSQVGHYHLYINKEMDWDTYADLLSALARAGVVEDGYANASIARGYSAVRPVGVQKVDAPSGAQILKQNAEFRVLIYELRQMLEYETARAEQNVDWDLVAERDQLADTAKELYEENQRIQHESNQLREELNRARLQQANNAAISWT